ncbi:hypothetical protein [Nisaea sp.]|uniref:AbiU2 domain-containing protein n=1 Tax=Nisaea sp. TaxID=2024842 RepID=UPI003B5239CE
MSEIDGFLDREVSELINQQNAEDADRSRVIQKIDNNCRVLIQNLALFEALNEKARDYPRSRAAHAYNWIVNAVLSSAALCVARLWDKHNDTDSVPRLEMLLQTPGFSRSLIFDVLDSERRLGEELSMSGMKDMHDRERARALCRSAALRDANDRAREQIERRGKILQMICQMKEADALRHIREFRHTELAHSLEISREGRRRRAAGLEVRNPLIEELREFASGTIELAQEIQICVRAFNPGYGRYANDCRAHVEDLIARGLLAGEC